MTALYPGRPAKCLLLSIGMAQDLRRPGVVKAFNHTVWLQGRAKSLERLAPVHSRSLIQTVLTWPTRWSPARAM